MKDVKNVIRGHIIFEKICLNTYCFCKDIKNIDPNLVSITTNYMKNTDAVIYQIKYITMEIINNQKIDRAIPLYLGFNDVDAYVVEENENKYLIFALTQNNKEL